MKALVGIFGIFGVIAWFGLIIAGIAGWIMNIFDLIGMADTAMSDVTFMFVLRIVGIFVFPLGGILGWF